MSYSNKDLCPEFSGIKPACHKRKVYEACIMFAMENYKILKENFDQDMFPSSKYYTLDDKLDDKKSKVTKKNKKITAPPKNKRRPVVCSSDQETSDSEEKSEENPEEKPKRKSYPISLNQNAKNVIDFVIGRFLWEIYTIELDSSLESKSDIEKNVLESILTEWSRTCNITELIINSVNIFKPSKIIKNSHGLNKELVNVLDEHLENSSIINFVSDYLTEFIKLLMLFFSNRMWLEKTQTVNLKIFENVLRNIELAIPIECKTVSNGLMAEIYQYDNNIIKSKKETKKSADKKPAVKKETKKPAVKKETKKPAVKKETKKPTVKKETKKPAVKKETKKPAVKKETKKPADDNSEDDNSEDDNWDDNYESE